MRRMTEDELTMFQILKNNKDCRNNNWEAVRRFYMTQYGINLPALRGVPTIWTIERMIRSLKEVYPNELTDQEERQIKEDMQSVYKEKALDRNKPMKPKATHEQIGLGLPGGDNLKEWW